MSRSQASPPASERRPIPELERLGTATRPSWLTPASIRSAAELEEPPFAPGEYAGRVRNVRERLEARGIDAVLVFRPASVDYLCGHHTIAAVPQPLLVRAGETRVFVPDDELGRALASASVDAAAHYRSSEDALAVIAGHIASVCGRGARIALEDRDASVPPRIASLLAESGLDVVPGGYLVEELRLRLSDAEIAHMERAGEVTAAGVRAAVEAYAPGETDAALAGAIERALCERSESSAATRAIVATGRRGGITHSTFDQVVLDGGTTFVEFAGTWQRYHTPVMITMAAGELDATEARLERLAQTTLAAVLREARPGRTAADVAAAVTAELGELTDADIFHFNFGYAVGLAHPPGWMDGAPFSIVAENERQLEPGMAFHVPASFRCFGRAAVGLSHTIVLDDDGARPLTGTVGGGVIR